MDQSISFLAEPGTVSKSFSHEKVYSIHIGELPVPTFLLFLKDDTCLSEDSIFIFHM